VYEDVGAYTGWHFFHTNHQGSVLYTTRAATSGALHTSFHYGAYGESSDAPTGNPIRYTGRYLDAETGLYYYRARYYSPKLGRFLQTDPIGIKDDLNLYAYVYSDPLNRSDPSGMCDMSCPAIDQDDRALLAGEMSASEHRDRSAARATGAIVGAITVVAVVATRGTIIEAAPAIIDEIKEQVAPKVTPGSIPKAPTGRGSAPPDQRDPKRLYTRKEVGEGLEAQGGDCAQCGDPLELQDAEGHHKQRHADGGRTTGDNLAVVCEDCHDELHKKE